MDFNHKVQNKLKELHVGHTTVIHATKTRSMGTTVF